jgi:hypothetical protein
MPIIALFTPPKSSDAGHQVLAPGGYEIWSFDAEDPAMDTRIVAVFGEGPPYHQGYLRTYSAYLRRPTRRTPPLARDYPYVGLSVYRRGWIVYEFWKCFRPGALCASTNEPEVTLGPNRMTRNTAGDYLLHLEEGRMSADVTFSPKFGGATAERTFPSRGMMGAEHRWVVAAPLCEVSGAIRFRQKASENTIEFQGRGYHDHHYGTAPLGLGLKRWIRGRVLLDERAIAFQMAEPRDKLAMESELLEADREGIRHWDEQRWTFPKSRRARWRTPDYPEEMRCGEKLKLSQPCIIDPMGSDLRIIYSAQLEDGSVAQALCDVTHPQRR